MSSRREDPSVSVQGKRDSVKNMSQAAIANRLQKYEGLSPSDSHHDEGHLVEREVQRQLLDSQFNISSLVVHRVPGGVCLEGTLWTNEGNDLQQVNKTAKSVKGVQQVLNHLVQQEPLIESAK